MNLKLFLEQTRQLWTLQPNRDIYLGCGQGCDIVIGQPGELADRHLKFSFDPGLCHWVVENLSPNGDSLFNGQPFTRMVISQYGQIAIASRYNFLATPEPDTVPVPPTPSNSTPQSMTPVGYGAAHSIQPPAQPAGYGQGYPNAGLLRVLTSSPMPT
jgi:hypothetical protein